MQEDVIYTGRCIFISHTMGNIHVKYLLNFMATTTIQAKQCYKWWMSNMGVMVQAYQSHNGIFTHQQMYQ